MKFNFYNSNLNLNNKSILVTGGTGSFGKAFTKKILNLYKPKRLIIFSRDEHKQNEMANELKKYSNILRFFIGDVRDRERLIMATKGVDFIIHAAALKHVPSTEYNPFECIRTNIFGAENIIHAAINSNVKKTIALSTDKAANPINIYGASKLAADKIFISGNHLAANVKSRFSVVRYGNVVGSRGSVVPFFKELSKEGDFVPITHKDMTRFWITLDMGVDFVLKNFERMFGGEIFVPKIPSYRLEDLAKAVAPNCKMKIVGLRPGEKLHEEMVSTSDAVNTIEYSKYFVITPFSKFINWNKKKYMKANKNGKNCKSSFSYNSYNNKQYLTLNQIKKLIKSN